MSTDESRTDGDGAGEVESVAVICFERNEETGERIVAALEDRYDRVESLPYHDEVFESAFSGFDAMVAVMATGIATRKIAPLLEGKWDDPAVVAVDTGVNWAIPLVGGHHGANRLARELASIGCEPVLTTATEVAGERSVETQAEALDAAIVTPESTVATNLAVLQDDLGPVVRLDGPRAVLVPEDVTVLERRTAEGIVLGTGCRSGVEPDQCIRAWEQALESAGRERSAVEFVATGALKATESGLFEAAAELDLGVVLFDRETLLEFEGPTPSKAPDVVGWPGIAESSAIAGGREHELLLEKQSYDGAVTVAVGR